VACGVDQKNPKKDQNLLTGALLPEEEFDELVLTGEDTGDPPDTPPRLPSLKASRSALPLLEDPEFRDVPKGI
jgi:hypothetical protein